jgi:hypothetical protein
MSHSRGASGRSAKRSSVGPTDRERVFLERSRVFEPVAGWNARSSNDPEAGEANLQARYLGTVLKNRRLRKRRFLPLQRRSL